MVFVYMLFSFEMGLLIIISSNRNSLDKFNNYYFSTKKTIKWRDWSSQTLQK